MTEQDTNADPSGNPSATAREPLGPKRISARELRLVVLVALAGTTLRLLLSWISRGSNDIAAWQVFAEQIAEHGVLWMYGNVPLWNHPPLMGFLIQGLLDLSVFTGWRFPPTFKLVPIGADLLSAFLVFGVWYRRTGDFRSALRALVIFSLSLNAILVSAYHGNTDSLVGALILLACVAVERQSFLAAGLIAGSAINVKLIPLLMFPLLVANATPRQVVRFGLGACVGLLPFLPVLVAASAGFGKNAVAYSSNFDNWGIPMSIRLPWYLAREHGYPGIKAFMEGVRDGYLVVGRLLVVGAVLGTSAYSRFFRPLSVYLRAALGLAAFLILAPGFGVQYTTLISPVLVAVSLRWGLLWGLSSGLFIGSVYAYFWTGGFPLYSYLNQSFRIPHAALGLVSWCVLVAFVADSLPKLPFLGSLRARVAALGQPAPR